MVNLGRSEGCRTCRRRRIKCDEAKPKCDRCNIAGLECGGYARKEEIKIRFKDETQLTCRRYRPVPMRTLTEPVETISLNLFLRHFATVGRSLESGHGFFENIIPILNMRCKNSAAALAVSAIATMMFEKWRPDAPKTQLPQKRLIQAVQQLQADLRNPVTCRDDSTLMCILLLQFHQNLWAVTSLQKVSRTHQNGALAFIRQHKIAGFDSDTSKRMVLYVIHIEVSSAIREGRCVDPDLSNWLESTDNLPWNPGFKLDVVGISVAHLQHCFLRVKKIHAQCKFSPCHHYPELSYLVQQASELEKRLSQWPKSIPSYWHPEIWDSIGKFSPPIPMYLNTCEIYPSVQIASIWNTWRSYRLITLNILVHSDTGIFNRGAIFQDILDIVDSICYSVPFYIGSLMKTAVIGADENDHQIFPSYHNLPRQTERARPRANFENDMSAEDHMCHIIARGAWHIMSPLSQLVTLLSEGTQSGHSIPLRDGQFEWIKGQFIRVLTLLGLDQEVLKTGGKLVNLEKFASKVREGLRLTSGS